MSAVTDANVKVTALRKWPRVENIKLSTHAKQERANYTTDVLRLAEEGIGTRVTVFELAATFIADDDDIEARRAARCYLDVLTVKDGHEDEAVQHIKSVADYMAAANLVVCMQRGVGVQQDEDIAFHAFDVVAVRGDAAALLNAGKYFIIGRGMPKDEAKAVRAFERAARMGEPYATYNLALAAELGIAMKQDLARARIVRKCGAEWCDWR